MTRSSLLTIPRFAPVIAILDELLLSCQNTSTLAAAHNLLRTLTSDAKILSAMNSAEALDEVLEEIGFGGLLRSSSFSTCNDQDKQCAILTDKLIEVRIVTLAIKVLTDNLRSTSLSKRRVCARSARRGPPFYSTAQRINDLHEDMIRTSASACDTLYFFTIQSLHKTI